MKKINPKLVLDNRSEQLDPTNIDFLKSREVTLTQEVVSEIQRYEAKTTGQQVKGGLGSQAQKLLAKQDK